MTDKETLSDKIGKGDCVYGHLRVEDVKEFIKLLKEMFDYGNDFSPLEIKERIDKLAGDKLITKLRKGEKLI